MVNVLFLSCYADADFQKLILSDGSLSQAAQKFDKLLVKGFVKNGFNVDVVLFTKGSDGLTEVENMYGKTVGYRYCRLDGNVLKRKSKRKRFARNVISEWVAENKNGVVVIDALRAGALEFSRQAKKHGIPVVSIVTDFVDFLYQRRENFFSAIRAKLVIKAFYKQFKYTDLFVLLTAEMTDKINVNGRRVLVLEGISDSDSVNVPDVHKVNKTFLYSGAVSKQFGLENLVNAFIKADIGDYELHIYGSGDYTEELSEICKRNLSVKYFGTVPNEVMVERQKEARFLVNPRPIGDEYTKYSFPSKTIEYMLSGRPVVTTRLPGIPDEYNDYLLFFDDDSEKGIENTLKRATTFGDDFLNDFGAKGRQFVATEKNNKIQTVKIIEKLLMVKDEDIMDGE